MIADPILLPKGIRIGAGIDLNEKPAVRVDLDLTLPTGATITAAIVVSPRQARALGALLIRQGDLVEGRPGTGWAPRLVESGR